MKNVVILVAIIGICLIAATIPVGNAASDNYNVGVRWLEFVHEKLVMDDYIIQVEFEVPSVGHYEAKRTPCARYLSELTPLEFNAQESWLSLSAKLTITAFWHLNDVIIDINPNPADGRWIPGAYFEEAAKKASALVISYTIGNEPTQFSADGNDDGYLSDLNNDAYIKLVVETLKDGEVIPEFPTWTAWLVAIAVSTLAAILGAKKNTLQKQKTESDFTP
jgi:hypothetical protein